MSAEGEGQKQAHDTCCNLSMVGPLVHFRLYVISKLSQNYQKKIYFYLQLAVRGETSAERTRSKDQGGSLVK